jgi:hypothetical protein
MATTTATRRCRPVPDHVPVARICATAERLPTRECGQPLDTCPARSCPRCGADVAVGPTVRRRPCLAGWNP